MLSVLALLRKNTKLKTRNLSGTCCEIVLPVLLVLLIVFGYFLSEEVKYGERNYAGELLDIRALAGTAFSDFLATDTDSDVDVASLYNYNGPTPVMNFDQFIEASKQVQALQSGIGIDISQLDSTFNGLLKLGRIALSPDTPQVAAYRDYMARRYSNWDEIYLQTFTSEEEAIDFAKQGYENLQLWALINFDALSYPTVADFTLRFNYSSVPSTKRVFQRFPKGLDTKYRQYIYSGFMTLQRSVEDFLSNATATNYPTLQLTGEVNTTLIASGQSYQQCVSGTTCFGSSGTVNAADACANLCESLQPNFTATGDSTTNPTKVTIPTPVGPDWMVPYPTAGYTSNQFYDFAGPLMGMIICMSALYPVSQLTKAIVEEKETRMRELLKMMGLTDGALNAAWTITYAVMFFTVAFLDAVLLKVTAFSRTEFTLLLLWLILFFSSLVTFCFFMATFFSRSKLSAIVSPIALFSTILPRYIFFRTDQAEAMDFKIMAALLSPTCFTFAADEMAKFEGANRGVSFDTMFEDDGLNFGVCLVILAVDTGLFGLAAWYLDKVLPSAYGTRRVWYFCFLPSFWKGEGGGAGVKAHQEEIAPGITPLIEDVPKEWDPSVQLDGLRKVFDDGAKVAVHHLCLSMYEGQITALLGHNGAGKTTTISMISGLIPPSGGDCTVYGQSILSSMDAIRHGLGVCPQHDVLYAQLTVLEHMKLFGVLKGVKRSELDTAALDMIHQVGLDEKTDVMSLSLSGGQKRKLSLGISLIGSSRFVLCDEPTSGMDPHSRRAIWELLRQSKQYRTIVLTTHFMDEADLLGDRIAIMTHGELACVGSPLFLKKHYGIGYRLVLTKAGVHCQEDQLNQFVTSMMADADRAKSAAGEMVWHLPFEAISKFGEFFTALEQQQEALGVGGYGISMTTLEECFIQIAEQTDETEPSDASQGNAPPPIYQRCETPHMKPDEMPPSDEGHMMHSSFGDTPKQIKVQQSAKPPSRLPALAHPAYPANTTAAHPANTAISKQDKGAIPMASVVASEKESPTTTQVVPFCNEGSEQHTDLPDEQSEQSISSPVPCDSVVSVPSTSVTSLNLQALGPPSGPPPRASPKVHPCAPIGEGLVSALDVKPEATSPWVQFGVQYRKRATVAFRDAKALFYEVGLPVILVFCVMLILTADFNPAGPSMKLSPTLMGDYDNSEAFLLNGNKQPNTAAMLKTHGEVPFVDDPDPTSYELGENKLLPEISAHELRRYGSTVFDDFFAGNSSITVTNQQLQDAGVNNVTVDGTTIGVGNGLPTQDLTFKLNATTVVVLNSTTLQPTGTTFKTSDLQNTLDDLNINLNVTSLINNTAGSSNTFTLRSSNVSQTVSLTGNNFNVTLTQGALQALSPTLVNLLLGQDARFTYGVTSELTVMFNATSPHSLPSYMAQSTEARLKSTKGVSSSFIVRSHPLPLTEYQSAVIKGLLSLFASLFLLVPFCYLPASYSMFVVKERVGMVKHVMLVSGQNLTAYWASNLFWDLTQYAMVVGSCMLVFLFFEGNIFTKDMEYATGMLVLLALYGTSSIPLSYCYSFGFKTHASAQIGIATINFCTGWVTVVAYYIMGTVENTKSLNNNLENIYNCFPPYVLGRSLLIMSETSFRTDILGQSAGVFDWDVIGKNLFILLLHTLTFIPLVLLIERFLMTSTADTLANCVGKLKMKLGCCEPAPEDDDETEHNETDENAGGSVEMSSVAVESGEDLDKDVIKERDYVQSGLAKEDDATVLLINDLCKVYPPRGNQRSKVAVNHLSVAVKRNSCFGLLGINGAGKSTTMAMLTGNVRPTSGDAFVNGHSICDSMQDVRKDIGFCPQFDSLSESLTAYENLRMYAKIKGIPSEMVEEVARELVELVGLSKFASRRSGTYSGGNKRKLSLAIALIGNPSLVMLDEPSTGMDPVARKQMWLTIERTAANRSVILTTHSMEECEALCDRVVVMVKGQFRCLGSIQHLKCRFGEGYTVEIKTDDKSAMPELTEFVHQELHGRVEESMELWLKLSVPTSALTLAAIFRTLEEHRVKLKINDYSVSQTTLEQIFIRFARD